MNLVYMLIAAFGLAFGGYGLGHHNGHVEGMNTQKVSDQVQFDQVNKQLADQKVDAAAKLTAALSDNVKAIADRDAAKHKLETSLAQASQDHDALARRLSSLSLRFRTAQAAVGGPGGGRTQSASADAAGSAGAPGEIVQLPDSIAGDLRSLARQADGVLDAYRACYDDQDR